MNIIVGIPVVVLVIVAVLFITGAFDQDVKEDPCIEPITASTKICTPDIPNIPDDFPDIPTIPTTPLCVDQLYVEIYKVDIGHQVEEHHIPVLIFEGLLNCDIIEEYKKDPTLEIKYPNNMTITTTWDANTNGWQKGYEA